MKSIRTNYSLGARQYFERYGAGMVTVLNDFGPIPTFTESKVLDQIVNEMDKEMPITKLAEHRQWRDEQLVEVRKLKDILQLRKPNNLR